MFEILDILPLSGRRCAAGSENLSDLPISVFTSSVTKTLLGSLLPWETRRRKTYKDGLWKKPVDKQTDEEPPSSIQFKSVSLC